MLQKLVAVLNPAVMARITARAARPHSYEDFCRRMLQKMVAVLILDNMKQDHLGSLISSSWDTK